MMNKQLIRWLRKLMLAVMAIPGVVFAGNTSPATSSTTTATPQDSFDREFAKFDKDFDRLNQWQAETPASKKLKRAPGSKTTQPVSKPDVDAAPAAATSGGTVTPLSDDAPSAVPDGKRASSGARSSAVPRGLPKGAKVEKLAKNDRLGDQISDPEMRKKVQDLYKRSDVVVHQYVLPTN